jgi:hypothetical protein
METMCLLQLVLTSTKQPPKRKKEHSKVVKWRMILNSVMIYEKGRQVGTYRQKSLQSIDRGPRPPKHFTDHSSLPHQQPTTPSTLTRRTLYLDHVFLSLVCSWLGRQTPDISLLLVRHSCTPSQVAGMLLTGNCNRVP